MMLERSINTSDQVNARDRDMIMAMDEADDPREATRYLLSRATDLIAWQQIEVFDELVRESSRSMFAYDLLRRFDQVLDLGCRMGDRLDTVMTNRPHRDPPRLVHRKHLSPVFDPLPFHRPER